MKSALEFDETVVDEIITHRVDVIAVDVNEDIETVKKTFINEEYSRLPIYEGSIDHIIGFVSQKDFFKKYLTKKDDETFLLRDIMQEIHYVPHLMKISDIMKQMQKDKVHMAVVLDQYGGTLGIVTLEDILEQLVGAFRMFGRNTTNLQFHTEFLQPLESSHIGIVNCNGTCHLTLAVSHVHITDVDFLDRHAAFNQAQHILRVLADDEDLLLRACLADDLTSLLNREVTCLCI